MVGSEVHWETWARTAAYLVFCSGVRVAGLGGLVLGAGTGIGILSGPSVGGFHACTGSSSRSAPAVLCSVAGVSAAEAADLKEAAREGVELAAADVPFTELGLDAMLCSFLIFLGFNFWGLLVSTATMGLGMGGR